MKPSEKIGVVVFSFGLREERDEPGPCNRRLGDEVFRIANAEGSEVVVVSQWEVTKALDRLGMRHSLSVDAVEGVYLDSEAVMEAAAKHFRERGITKVIPIAHPFLHGFKCRKLVRDQGFTVVKRKVGWIGFDKESLQPYTRSPLKLLLYSIRQLFLGHRGS